MKKINEIKKDSETMIIALVILALFLIFGSFGIIGFSSFEMNNMMSKKVGLELPIVILLIFILTLIITWTIKKVNGD